MDPRLGTTVLNHAENNISTGSKVNNWAIVTKADKICSQGHKV